MDNHLKRPEIVVCGRDGIGMSQRFSDTLQKKMLYVAVPYQKGVVRGYIRVAMPFDDIDAASEHLHYLLLLAALLGLGIALFISGYVSIRFARSFRHLVSQSHALAERAVMTELEPVSTGGVKSGSFSHEQASELLQTSITQVATERDRIEAVLQGMNEGVIGLDAHMRVTLVNRGARELLNLPEHTVGMAIQRLVPLADFQRIISDAQDAPSTEAEIQLTSPGSRLVLVRTTRQRSTEGIVVVLYDITRIRHLEQMRRDFVANVSHELRTPVSVVQLNAETLLQGALEDEANARGFVEGIMRNAKRLSRIIDDLLDLSRIEAGKYSIWTTEVHVNPLVHRVVDAYRTQIDNKEIRLEVDVNEDTWVLGDENALEQILSNLVDNATKYTPHGGLIRVRARAVLSSIRIEVMDNGPGIPVEHQGRLFERFYRVDAGRSREMGGTGLGLAIVKHLTAALDGQVGVDSHPGEGAHFWVILPQVGEQDSNAS
jgi:two-component system phosphate regulon sensor histidine kinase PhoR